MSDRAAAVAIIVLALFVFLLIKSDQRQQRDRAQCRAVVAAATELPREATVYLSGVCERIR